jgi:hypothetical protein
MQKLHTSGAVTEQTFVGDQSCENRSHICFAPTVSVDAPEFPPVSFDDPRIGAGRIDQSTATIPPDLRWEGRAPEATEPIPETPIPSLEGKPVASAGLDEAIAEVVEVVLGRFVPTRSRVPVEDERDQAAVGATGPEVEHDLWFGAAVELNDANRVGEFDDSGWNQQAETTGLRRSPIYDPSTVAKDFHPHSAHLPVVRFVVARFCFHGYC